MSRMRQDITNTGRRFALLAVVLSALVGCTSTPKPVAPPVDLPLQDPPPGRAIVYLLRAPYDDLAIDVSVGTRTLAKLPASTYTAVVLPPGKYTLITRVDTMLWPSRVAAPPFHLELQADERRFVSLSGHTAKQLGLSGMIFVPGAGMVPLLSSDTGTAPGTRAWKEVSEIDAQGLMSIARVVLPPAESL